MLGVVFGSVVVFNTGLVSSTVVSVVLVVVFNTGLVSSTVVDVLTGCVCASTSFSIVDSLVVGVYVASVSVLVPFWCVLVVLVLVIVAFERVGS